MTALDYRESHVGPHSDVYTAAMNDGYPGLFWRLVEAPILDAFMQQEAGEVPASVHVDLACGAGRLMSWSRARMKIGVDFSPDMIRHAAGRDDAHLIRADCLGVPMRSQSADLITMFRFLLNTDEDRRLAALVEAARLCRTNGHVVFNIQCMTWSLQSLTRRTKRILGLPSDESMSVEDVRRLLHGAGLEELRFARFGLIPVSARLRGNALGRLLARLESGVAHKWPALGRKVGNHAIFVVRPVVRS